MCKLVTVGIPFYNPPIKEFEDAIRSVLCQSYTNLEILLINDGSEEYALDIARKFSDRESRVRLIDDSKNLGLPARLNQISKMAKGEFVARMDADDLIAQDRIEKQVRFLNNNPHLDVVSSSFASISNKGINIQYIGSQEKLNLDLRDLFLGRSGIIHASILARKNWMLRNQYNENSVQMEDYELWIRAALNDDLKIGYIHQPLYFYREGINVTKLKMLRGYTNQREFLRSIPLEKEQAYLSFLVEFSRVIFLFKILFVKVMSALRLEHRMLNLRRNRKYDFAQIKSIQCEMEKFQRECDF